MILSVAHLKTKKCELCGNTYEGMGGETYENATDKHYLKYGYMLGSTVYLAKEEHSTSSEGELFLAIFPESYIPTPGKWYITSGYGSVCYDMDTYEVEGQLDPVFDQMVICDACVSALVSDKKIKRVHSGM